MTPDHETNTLEGLIARWRWAASLGKVTKDPAIAAQQAGWAQCADELAPILAGLRELRDAMDKESAYKESDKWVIRNLELHKLAKILSCWLGQSATGDSHGK